ncbi:MAG TPA: 3-dehydroquinate synthase, partial [Planctomycetota bacterium]|nr:3-dehydroquinate synthase [Planctomycetota bacterium]
MRTLKVAAAGGSYPVFIGAGARAKLGDVLGSGRRPSRLHVVTDTTVERHHGRALRRLLEDRRLEFSSTVVASGERSKSAGALVRIWRACIRSALDRDGCLLAFGGGVVGDLAGFAAGSLYRGIDFIQVPTTLLSMVDASVGGKTGINLPEGKNLVGVFHAPRAVVMDLDFLDTLPERQVRSGWAEVIKSAAIRDERLFRELDREREALLAREPGSLARVIERCVRIKARVVEKDEREGGLRRILNFGHTLGHALEKVAGYGKILHGEAVAVGMSFAAGFGEDLGHTRRGTAERLRALLEAYGLPTWRKGLSARRLLDAMSHDKKRGPRGV